MSAWVRHEPVAAPAGDVGGDLQVSEAFSARWSKPSKGMFAVVTRAYYTVRSGGVEECTEYLLCRDARRPGDTEVWSDARHRRVDGTDPKRLAERAQEPNDYEWAEVAP